MTRTALSVRQALEYDPDCQPLGAVDELLHDGRDIDSQYHTHWESARLSQEQEYGALDAGDTFPSYQELLWSEQEQHCDTFNEGNPTTGFSDLRYSEDGCTDGIPQNIDFLSGFGQSTPTHLDYSTLTSPRR